MSPLMAAESETLRFLVDGSGGTNATNTIHSAATGLVPGTRFLCAGTQAPSQPQTVRDHASTSRRESVVAVPSMAVTTATITSASASSSSTAQITFDNRTTVAVAAVAVAAAAAAAATASCSLHPPLPNPATPGPSSSGHQPHVSSHDRCKTASHFIPPARPSSTPFPHPERRNSVCCQDLDRELDPDVGAQFPRDGDDGTGDEADVILTDSGVDHFPSLSSSPPSSSSSSSLCAPDADVDVGCFDADPVSSSSSSSSASAKGVHLVDLPAEIHEAILDHLFGYRVSMTSKSSMGMHKVTVSWGTVMRHSRRRELSDLALVNNMWRCLIQERLFRHVKIRATVESIEEETAFFVQHPHLQAYVRHLELWFPVFQRADGPAPLARGRQLQANHLRDGSPEPQPGPTYTIPMGKCTIREVFDFVYQVLPRVRILTLEGGERRKAPQVLHSARPAPAVFAKLETVQTLVTKGQWNLMRQSQDFHNVLSALPNLREWHGSYSRPKSKSYLSMAAVLPHLPVNLTQLHVCLEGEYRRELACPAFFRKVSSQLHFCTALAAATPTLEHLSYTGRICKTFFDVLNHRTDPRATRLKSINITARNCCRPASMSSETGCGIQDLSFMHAFEMLVVSGIRSLAKLSALEYLRIRYIDLDSPIPPLNPFFMIRDGWVAGVWSETILAELQRSPRSLRYEEIRDTFGDISYNKEGRMVISPDYPRPRILSLKIANYALLADNVTMPQQ